MSHFHGQMRRLVSEDAGVVFLNTARWKSQIYQFSPEKTETQYYIQGILNEYQNNSRLYSYEKKYNNRILYMKTGIF